MGQTRVVERAPLLGHPHRAAAEVGDEPLGDRVLVGAGGEAEHAAVEPVEVDLGAGEGHRRVQRHGPRADGGGRGEHGEAVPAGGVHDVLPGAQRAAVGEHADDVAEHVVGHGEEQQVGGARHGAGLVGRDAGQQGRHPAAGGVGLTGGGHDLVTGGAQPGGQDGADAAGADDADAQARAGLV